MTRHLLLISIALALPTAASLAQSQQPYAGLEARSIKALSDQQIADLKAGRGMGLALAAELNGHPGPMHVLELADPLNGLIGLVILFVGVNIAWKIAAGTPQLNVSGPYENS